MDAAHRATLDEGQPVPVARTYHGTVIDAIDFAPSGLRAGVYDRSWRARVRYGGWLAATIVLLAMAGCSSMLPRASSVTSSFRSFEDLRDAVDSLRPMQSSQDTLMQLGLDPGSLPNSTILTYTDLLRRFAPGTVAIKEDLDPGIVACLAARNACRGWELNVASIRRVRTGNFWADFFNFRRRTVISGWRFNALVLLADGQVVYRAWGGQPLVNEIDDRRSPLGPLQDIGPAVVVGAP